MAHASIAALLTGTGDPSKDIASFLTGITAVAEHPVGDAMSKTLPHASSGDEEDAQAEQARRDAAAASVPEKTTPAPSDYDGGSRPAPDSSFDSPTVDLATVYGAADIVLSSSAPCPPADGSADVGGVPDASADSQLPSPPRPIALPDDADGDGDSDSYSDESYSLSKPSFGDLFSKPVEFFKRSPKLGRTAAIGAVGLVAAIGAGIMFGDHTASVTPPAAPPAVVADAPGGEEVGTEATVLLPKEVSASCPPGSTSPSMAFSNRPENAWVCPRAYGIDGAAMNIIFPKTVVVKSITVMAGWNYVAPNGRDHWNEHRLVTKILWRIGGQQFEQNITPSRSGSTLTLPGNGVATTVMSLTILTTARPDAINPDSGEGGGFLTPGGDTGPQNSDVDKSTAVGSVTIMGTEI